MQVPAEVQVGRSDGWLLNDRIRLIDLLRKSPAPAGFFYRSSRWVLDRLGIKDPRMGAISMESLGAGRPGKPRQRSTPHRRFYQSYRLLSSARAACTARLADRGRPGASAGVRSRRPPGFDVLIGPGGRACGVRGGPIGERLHCSVHLLAGDVRVLFARVVRGASQRRRAGSWLTSACVARSWRHARIGSQR